MQNKKQLLTIYLKYILIIISFILIDQLSKLFFIHYFDDDNSKLFVVNKFLSFTYAWNYGISFGFLSEYRDQANLVFFVINTVISFYLFKLFFKYLNSHFLQKKSRSLNSRSLNNNDLEKDNSSCLALIWSLVFILSGAVGNIIDRVIHGGVFDFILLHYKSYFFSRI
ncbi:MAG TPA: signal peptidase II [Candidatus Megaira endosymbiont of Hartmannula sinica]|nr:signal peptidase II [Candidatus Megaera endosymbiont of Hartmannula sinica]